ncbi:MAG: ATPase, T2SS/T4P/T4SS family [Sideroxydans sp.]|nr:ATPase, T2SS/T4P/T4SS family [Sideroxydans sp.]MDD5056634.1 ATPase, T2SS/T4P/T4SS family [Sideroxydans sp.]
MQNKLFISTSKDEEAVVGCLNDVIIQAVHERVADVHFQMTDGLCRIRFRMPGGSLVNHRDIPRTWMTIIDEKIRARARLSVTDRLGMQDGRISLRINSCNVDIRVAISPGVNGSQLIVCRLLDQSNSNRRLADINMTPAVREAFDRVLLEPNGLLLVTGPTGSGKTTTLYALLNELNNEARNIITIENPVEYRIAEFHQINVDGQSVTFASALRSVLRQDPDVILIGEIRDQETANIAVQAAITGHLVLSTLHANNAAMAITRMLEFGIDPHTLSAALRGVTAQRLIRTLASPEECDHSPPNDAEKAWLKASNAYRPNAEYLQPTKGYKGFTPVMEVILADHRVKKAFLHGVDEIYAAASRQSQFETLAQAAEHFAFSGVTSLEEACRVSSIQEAPTIKNRRLGQVLVERGMVSAESMHNLLSLQSDGRKQGNHQRIGKLLLDQGMCSAEDLIEAVGFTAEAHDILLRVCITEERRHALANLVQKWTPGVDSLFRAALDSNLVSSEELTDANTF